MDASAENELPDRQPTTTDTTASGTASSASEETDPSSPAHPSESPTQAVPADPSGNWHACPGDTVGGYRLLTKVAYGGMGEVWEAEDIKLRRSIALKLIRPDKLTPALIRRFEVESLAQARLHHDGIAQVFHADANARRPFIAMELIRGAKRLTIFAQAHALSVTARLELLRRVADAIAHAHEQQVIHLDLKPSNILVRADGQPKVLDFGTGRLLDAPIDDGDLVIATPSYMSPEQGARDSTLVDARSDVYSLGVIAFELFDGRLPYDVSGKTFSEVRDFLTARPPHHILAKVRGDARKEIQAVIDKALDPDPGTRYSSAGALRDDLKALIDRRPTSVVRHRFSGAVMRWLRDDAHVPWSGQALSLTAWLIAGVCLWFITVVLFLPSVRDVLTPQVRVTEFVPHESQWVIGMLLAGVVARLAGRRKPLMMWLMLAIASGLTAFTVAVASGIYAYDAAGSAANPIARAMVFTLLSGIAFVSLILTVVMIGSHYVRDPWHAVPEHLRA